MARVTIATRGTSAGLVTLLAQAAAPLCATTEVVAHDCGEADEEITTTISDVVVEAPISAVVDAAAPNGPVIVAHEVKRCEIHHGPHAHGPCGCHWWDRLTAFDWLHILTEILVHIALHAILHFAFKSGKKALKTKKQSSEKSESAE